MDSRRRFNSRLLSIPLLMLIFAAVLLGQTQEASKAQTQPQSKAQTQPQTKAETKAEVKAHAQPQTKAQTKAEVKAHTQPQTKASTQQPGKQTQKAIPKKAAKIDKRTTAVKSFPGQCQAITENGTRCPRKALPGSKYCRQHGGR